MATYWHEREAWGICLLSCITLQVMAHDLWGILDPHLRAHQRTGTRTLHYVGSILALAMVVAAVIWAEWWLLPGAVVIGYGLAWIGHLAVEGNRPATFGHPVWSLLSDYRMLLLWLTGRLGPHLVQAAKGRR